MIVAIYCRLSKEDDAKTQESESIQNQKSLLLHYAFEKGWDVYNIYCDDDFKGCDRNRPAFNRMIKDAKQGVFQIVLCKSQARFTRDMEMVEKYIHGLFPVWGIRFIALADNADTSVKGNKKARQINGLVNEWYLEDLSENIRMVFDDKRAQGKYLGANPPYGLRKDPANHNHLLIDEDSAGIVRRIFGLAAQGRGCQFIADTLNEERLPNPTQYKRLHGLGYYNPTSVPGHELWTSKSIKRILHNRMYLGEMVQGRKKKVSYKSDLIVAVPKNQWIVVTGTHDATIDSDTFDAVQRLMASRTRVTGLGDHHLFAGKIRCMDCGSALSKQICTYKGKRTDYLRCRLFSNSRQLGLCTRHSIRVDCLSAIVSEKAREHIRLYYDGDPESLIEESGLFQSQQETLRNELHNTRAQTDRQTRVLKDLFFRKSDGLLDEALFLEMSRTCIAEKKALEQRSVQVEEQLTKLENPTDDRAEKLEHLQKWLNFEELTRELVCELIDFIEVGERNCDNGDQEVKIHWNF